MKRRRYLVCCVIIVLLLVIVLICLYVKRDRVKNSFFFARGQKEVEYEGIFCPLSGNLIEQNIKLNIRKVKVFEEAVLWALELDQLDVEDPEDEIRMGRRYLGYFYVTKDMIYQETWLCRDGFSRESDEEVINWICTDEADFLAECRLVCTEEGTEDIADEQGWHSYVEVDGEKRIYHMYNDYMGGTKAYERIIWERGKGIVYYLYGAGSSLMEVEIGFDLYDESGMYDVNKANEIEEYLKVFVPELKDCDEYIEEKSDGQAYLIIEVNPLSFEIEGESFYAVYVGEQWSDHRVNWDWFYVNEQVDEILWYNFVEDEICSLEEWRSSEMYREIKGNGEQELENED